MEGSKVDSGKDLPLGLDAATEEEYTLQSKLLQEFTSISNIDKAWTFNSGSGINSQAMFLVSQPNLLANKRRKFILSTEISKESTTSVNFRWAPFPVEMTGVSIIVPSPSGEKLLVVRNPENESPCQIEIWSSSQLEKEYHVPQSVHGSIYTDGWFEGISWNSDETLIAYAAEEPSPTKPTFNDLGYKKGGSPDKDFGSWNGQGDWEEDWGETYAGKRQPVLFVININSGEVQAVKGIGRSLSVGQVVWAPSIRGSDQYLVFVGWSSDTRKLGIKYCYNRPCALYAVRAPFYGAEGNTEDLKDFSTEDVPVVKLTPSISSAFFPRFSPNGKFLIFLSARSSVDSGAHSATNSLHTTEWATDGNLPSSLKIVDVINDACEPLIVVLHGGPHSVSVTSFSKSLAFLSSIGFNLLIVNYRGSLGFGEEALQSLPGKVGTQDVNDVLTAINHVKTPTIFLLGAKDLRVPISTGLQYARVLKKKGVDVKTIVFPDDVHEIERP
ncbi:Peptidase [Parasponia andersonii]|uniref:acylaminoacyl-peptidase n=1 Tax=Parasponia andersonii TaxID=3476 RepID=A0A2P5AUH2_PARAD|nr:Peptidase [Parasponia andersonii]